MVLAADKSTAVSGVCGQALSEEMSNRGRVTQRRPERIDIETRKLYD
jgi:hypothetical protein